MQNRFCYNNKAEFVQPKQYANMAQLVEHILGKDEVPGSNPGISLKRRRLGIPRAPFLIFPILAFAPCVCYNSLGHSITYERMKIMMEVAAHRGNV